MNNRHEYLITQVQYQETVCKNNDKIFLNFQNPIKEFFFVLQKNENVNNGEVFNYSGKGKYLPIGITEFTERLWEQIPDKHLLDTASLDFDGNERVSEKDYKYWHLVQNYEHYRNTMVHNIYMYSFGLSNSENTGSCNFSELENIVLNIKLATPTTEYIHYTNNDTVIIGPENSTIVKIYGVNYNIFVIDSGLGAIKYPY
jgi:hypothetical protein